jgi:transcription termination factor Rho
MWYDGEKGMERKVVYGARYIEKRGRKMRGNRQEHGTGLGGRSREGGRLDEPGAQRRGDGARQGQEAEAEQGQEAGARQGQEAEAEQGQMAGVRQGQEAAGRSQEADGRSQEPGRGRRQMAGARSQAGAGGR